MVVTYSSFLFTHKVFIDMKRHKNFNLLLMLVLLVAVGQMAQTIYIPAIADMAVALNVREGAVQRDGGLPADLRYFTAILRPAL